MCLILEILLGKKASKANKANVGQSIKGGIKSKKVKKQSSLTTLFQSALNKFFSQCFGVRANASFGNFDSVTVNGSFVPSLERIY